MKSQFIPIGKGKRIWSEPSRDGLAISYGQPTRSVKKRKAIAAILIGGESRQTAKRKAGK